MPTLLGSEVNYEQICELVKQLEFNKRICLLKEITRQKDYRENFYAYTESLARKYCITRLSDDELDTFLHD